MKEISGSDVLGIMFEELNINSCTFYDINMWKRNYNERFPDVYVDVTRDVMSSIPSNRYYFDYKNSVFYKQEQLKCPICGDVHYKYPENETYKKLEKYYKINKLHEITNGKSQTA